MTTVYRILHAEDDLVSAYSFGLTLESVGAVVIRARTGPDALDLARRELPDLIVLDLRLPGMDGFDVCRYLRRDARTGAIPILMLTGIPDEISKAVAAGADDYVDKLRSPDELRARVSRLLQRPRQDASLRIEVTLTCEPQQLVRLRATGALQLSVSSEHPLDVDIDSLARIANGMRPDDEWRTYSRYVGERLFEALFKTHYAIGTGYAYAEGIAQGNQRRVHLCIESGRGTARVPWELLWNEEPLARRHPFFRRVTDSRPATRLPVSDALCAELRRRGQALRALIVGASTRPRLPSVDLEVAAVDLAIREGFTQCGVRVETTALSSAEVDAPTLERVLRSGQHHLVHYCGHGWHDAASPERSYLQVWSAPGESGHPVPISAVRLREWLEGTDVRLFYLSCCTGARSSGLVTFVESDFLGVADALLQAGIPSVIGFREPVRDNIALTMAQRFYSALPVSGGVDVALLDARQAVGRDNRAWQAVMLFQQ